MVLEIAGYRIKLGSADMKKRLLPGSRFENFIVPDDMNGSYDLEITVHPGIKDVPPGARCVFNAPYAEEAGGRRETLSPEFWSVWSSGGMLYLKTVYPGSGGRRSLLSFSPDSISWDLYTGDSGNAYDPLEYPLDGLILYYLTVMKGDIMIHASGIRHAGKGYIFSGVSGRGKTTMAGLWQGRGAKVIHDDRLIISRKNGRYRFGNTPVYDNEKPEGTGLDRIYIIGHGDGNSSQRITGAEAVTAVMANCIQHNWGKRTVETLLGSVSDLCGAIPVYRLAFSPCDSVIDHILSHGQ